jgi:hypothetical protein
MRMTGLKRAAQRCAYSQQMRLTDVFIKRPWTQSIGQWSIIALAYRHLPLRPITSTPGGGTNEKRSGANLALRCEWVKVS